MRDRLKLFFGSVLSLLVGGFFFSVVITPLVLVVAPRGTSLDETTTVAGYLLVAIVLPLRLLVEVLPTDEAPVDRTTKVPVFAGASIVFALICFLLLIGTTLALPFYWYSSIAWAVRASLMAIPALIALIALLAIALLVDALRRADPAAFARLLGRVTLHRLVTTFSGSYLFPGGVGRPRLA